MVFHPGFFNYLAQQFFCIPFIHNIRSVPFSLLPESLLIFHRNQQQCIYLQFYPDTGNSVTQGKMGMDCVFHAPCGRKEKKRGRQESWNGGQNPLRGMDVFSYVIYQQCVSIRMTSHRTEVPGDVIWHCLPPSEVTNFLLLLVKSSHLSSQVPKTDISPLVIYLQQFIFQTKSNRH